MTLYVLRHAIAERRSAGRPDSARELTSRGRRKAGRVLAHARKVGVLPSTILTSPYSRAAQTAAIAVEALGFVGSPIVTQALVPFGSLFDLWNEIREQAAGGDVMVVGHNPLLSSLVTWSIGARAEALWLKKSGLVALDVAGAGPQPRATLSWLLTPKSVGR